MSSKPAWATGRTGPIRYFQDLAVFACEGLIAIIDQRPQYEGDFVVVTPSDMQDRINVVARTYRNKTRVEHEKWQREVYDEVQRGCQAVQECIKEAKAMGDPSDPRVRAWWKKHRRNSSVRVSLSEGNDPEGYPKLPPLTAAGYTGKIIGRDGQGPPALFTGQKSHQPPRKKNRYGIIEL